MTEDEDHQEWEAERIRLEKALVAAVDALSRHMGTVRFKIPLERCGFLIEVNWPKGSGK